MNSKINLWAFISTFVCIALFFLAMFSSEVIEFTKSYLHTQPLNIVLIVSVITLILGVIGFSGMNNWKSMLRSIFTVVLTLVVSILVILIIVLANLFKFT